MTYERIAEMTEMAEALITHDERVAHEQAHVDAVIAEFEQAAPAAAPAVNPYLTRSLAERWAAQNGR